MDFKTVTIREVIMLGACLILAYFAFVKKWDNSQLQEDKIRAEEKIKVLETEKLHWHTVADSFKTEVSVTRGIIEYQKQNPKIIIEKYDKIISDVNMLYADGTIAYLSDRLSEEGSHR